MIDIPVKFPSARERLRRSIEATRSLGLLERLHVIDGLQSTIEQLRASSQGRVDHGRLRRIRNEEVRSCFDEFIRRQLAGKPPTACQTDGRDADRVGGV